jgi:putative DNA primase/helicase
LPWAPAAIAAIGELPGTVADRSVIVSMRRRRPDEPVDRLRADRPEQFVPIARRCARWAMDHLHELAAADPDVPESLNDRAADNWRPLLAIADAVGGGWPSEARTAALSVDGEMANDHSIRVMLLSDIRSLFDQQPGSSISSSSLAVQLADLEGRAR